MTVFGGEVKQDRFIFRYVTKIRFRARYRFPGKPASLRQWECHKNMAVEVKDVHAHCYCASLLRTRQIHTHVMHRARALRNKINNDREGGRCYSFAWI